MPTAAEVSIPGSLMLLGEHAVLRGRRAIACAVNKRATLAFRRRTDDRIVIRSQLGEYNGTLGALKIQPPFEFVLEAVRSCSERVRFGFELTISSELSPVVGFGSSAAVTAGTIAGLERLAGGDVNREELLLQARGVIRTVQGLGSGSDLAASIYGGVVCYQPEPLSVISLPCSHPIVAVYSGSKMRTPEVVRRVDALCSQYPDITEAIFDAIERSIDPAIQALRASDYTTFGAILNVNHGLLAALGVENAALSQIVQSLRRADSISGAKISGSGLGDCAIGWGRFSDTLTYQQIQIAIDNEGIRVGAD